MFVKIGWILIITALMIKFGPHIFKLFFARIPEIKGGVVISRISGRTGRVLKEGLHFIWPWQYIRLINLEKSVPKEINIESIPTKDGTISIKASYQYRPCIAHLTRFIENDESMISNGIEDMIKSFIGSFVSKEKSEEIISKWEKLEKYVQKKFKEEYEIYNEQLKRNVKYTELENKYGVEIIRISITDIDLPKEVGEQREKALKESYFEKGEKKRWDNTLNRMKQIKKNFSTISDKEALNTIQVERDKVKKHIIEIEGLNEAVKSITQSIIETLKGEKK